MLTSGLHRSVFAKYINDFIRKQNVEYSFLIVYILILNAKYFDFSIKVQVSSVSCFLHDYSNIYVEIVTKKSVIFFNLFANKLKTLFCAAFLFYHLRFFFEYFKYDLASWNKIVFSRYGQIKKKKNWTELKKITIEELKHIFQWSTFLIWLVSNPWHQKYYLTKKIDF